MSYTLSQYISNTAGSWVNNLPLKDSDIEFIIYKALNAYGVSTENQATDLQKLYALADVELWGRIVSQLAQDYAFTADGTTHNRNQAYEQAKELLTNALIKAESINVYGNCTINTSKLVYETDPYGYGYGYGKGLSYPAIYWGLL